MIPWLTSQIKFPSVETASPGGILALGGDLSVARLQLAYKSGIFPWYSHDEPIVWYSPDPRMVLYPSKLKISKSMKAVLKKGQYNVTVNENFEAVINACQSSNRTGQSGTWITEDMKKAYLKLHQLGWAKSIEIWMDDTLTGGLYGIDLGHVFCGESMFSKRSNASKLAFIYLVQNGFNTPFKLIDCQVYTSHLASLGAEEIPRERFLQELAAYAKNS